jgi:hypothetical protein
MHWVRLLVLILVMLAGFGVQAMPDAAAQNSHVASACHETQQPAPSERESKPVKAAHLCIGCAVAAPRPASLPEPAVPAARVLRPISTNDLAGRCAAPDTPPPRLFA